MLPTCPTQKIPLPSRLKNSSLQKFPPAQNATHINWSSANNIVSLLEKFKIFHYACQMLLFDIKKYWLADETLLYVNVLEHCQSKFNRSTPSDRSGRGAYNAHTWHVNQVMLKSIASVWENEWVKICLSIRK